jgi:hypothetical protein
MSGSVSDAATKWLGIWAKVWLVCGDGEGQTLRVRRFEVVMVCCCPVVFLLQTI